MPTHYRDISAERRERAAACVDRHLHELRELFGGDRVDVDVVEGSAVAAEVFLAETNTLHTAVRAAIYVRPGERTVVERTLRRNTFQRAEPAGDTTLLRLAARTGRRAIHVLIEGDRAAADPASSLHPADPRAARRRSARLASAWMPLASAFRRVRHDEHDDHDATESFEVHLIEKRV